MQMSNAEILLSCKYNFPADQWHTPVLELNFYVFKGTDNKLFWKSPTFKNDRV